MNLTKTFVITYQNSQVLKKLVPAGGIGRFRKVDEIEEDSVCPLQPLGDEYDNILLESMSHFGQEIGVIERGLWIFGNVGLHTDEIYPKTHVAAVIPVVGSGTLYVADGPEIKESRIGKSKYGGKLFTGVIFDDRKPHCYLGNSLMLAIICGVRRELLN